MKVEKGGRGSLGRKRRTWRRMDWKREAAEKLKCYEMKKGSLERTEQELLRLEEAFRRIRSARPDQEPLKGGGSRYEEQLVDNIAQRGELRQARREAARWVHIMDGALEALEEEERRILDRFFIHRTQESVELLCQELCLERSRVYERKEKALKRFTLALYGVLEN